MVNKKMALKSIGFYNCLYISAFVLLTSCADVPLPQWLSGEPSEVIIQKERKVRKPAELEKDSFPNIAIFPEKPSNISSDRERKSQINQMILDREKALKAKKRLENYKIPSGDNLTFEQSADIDYGFAGKETED